MYIGSGLRHLIKASDRVQKKIRNYAEIFRNIMRKKTLIMWKTCWITKLLSSYCGAHLFKVSNISDTNWLRYLSSSYLIKIYDVWRHHLGNLHILNLKYLWNEKRYLKIVNNIFLLIQTTFYVLKWLTSERCDFCHSTTLTIWQNESFSFWHHCLSEGFV